jgi:hypothetical protein
VEDETSEKVNLDTKEGKSPEFIEDDEGVLWYKEKICVPDIKESNDKILCEVHESTYSIHLGRNKMYHDHEQPIGGMKLREMLLSILLFVTHVRVKTKHQ